MKDPSERTTEIEGRTGDKTHPLREVTPDDLILAALDDLRGAFERQDRVLKAMLETQAAHATSIADLGVRMTAQGRTLRRIERHTQRFTDAYVRAMNATSIAALGSFLVLAIVAGRWMRFW